jgi:formylglycine-generating enzyme required for sulfatase activity
MAASLVWAPTPEPSPECPSPPGLDIKFRLVRQGSTMTDGNSLLAVQGPYCIGMYELTRSQQAQILGAPPIPSPDGDLPASALSYEDAEGLVQGVNRRDPSGHYRLPTGKQWEYAARGGTGGVAHFGANLGLLPEYGNCTGSDTGAKPVGSYKPNKFGLFDMYGNVSEWTSDFDVDKNGHVMRYRRGGGWRIEPKNCNSIQDFKSRSEDTNGKDFGLRLVRDPVPVAKIRR